PRDRSHRPPARAQRAVYEHERRLDRTPPRQALAVVADPDRLGRGAGRPDRGEQRGELADELDVGEDPAGAAAALELERALDRDHDGVAGRIDGRAEAAFEQVAIVERELVRDAGREPQVRRRWLERPDVPGAQPARDAADDVAAVEQRD